MGVNYIWPLHSVMAEMTDATNIANVSSLTHYCEPYAHFCIII